MSKAVLISIGPKWCSLIASGKKTIEVRKTRPKLNPPFKCYIYCTNAQKPALINLQNLPETQYLVTCGDFSRRRPLEDADWARLCNGKVIGEFICDAIFHFFNVCTDPWELLCGSSHANAKHLIKNCARLSEYELHDYARGQFCVGWHISNLVIYDTPKELSEFRRRCPNDLYCESCAMFNMNTETCGNSALVLKRPPQSWCYVEEET